VFALSMVLGPTLYQSIGMGGIFSLTGVLAIAAIWVVTSVVPPQPETHTTQHGSRPALLDVIRDPELLRLNFGIFALHMVLMAIFVIIPVALVRVGGLAVSEHWKVYLPAVLASFALMSPGIRLMEKKGRLKPVFIGCIVLMALIQLGFWLGIGHFYAIVGLLFGFFAVFNILEAALPSLITRFAPPAAKGMAIGVYNTTQTLGLFVGGVAGGWLAQHYGEGAVFVFGFVLVALWAVGASFMGVPPTLSNRRLAIDALTDPVELRARLMALAGVREAIVSVDEGAAYLKVNLEIWDERATMNLVKGASGNIS
jgi:predicted MFS family arabinose efflux permease